MSFPEIERLRERPITLHEPDAGTARLVGLDEAEQAILDALARQRREIVEALRERADVPEDERSWYLDAADFIESRFGEAPDA